MLAISKASLTFLGKLVPHKIIALLYIAHVRDLMQLMVSLFLYICVCVCVFSDTKGDVACLLILMLATAMLLALLLVLYSIAARQASFLRYCYLRPAWQLIYI